MSQKSRFLLTALLLAVTAAAPFLMGLPGDFIFDDVPNIVMNGPIQVDSLSPAELANAVQYGQMSGQSRILPTLTFAINYYMGHGLNPAIFKATNIAIHAATFLSLAFFLRLLLLTAGITETRARWYGLGLAFAWAVHPLQVSSVLYVVQRLQTMSTLFLVLALTAYLSARRAQLEGRSGRTGMLGAGLLWAAALSCKEDAAMLPAYTLALELTVLGFRAQDTGFSRRLQQGYGIAAGLGIALYALVVAPHYWTWDAYPDRAFSTPERLLTQGRVLCMYLWEMLVPLPSHMPFFYDWLAPSRGTLAPWTTLPAWGFLITLLALAWRLRKARPLFSLGIFLFFAGHFVTSNVIGLELAFEHRNHFPLIGVILATGDLLALAASRLRIRMQTVVAGCAACLIALGATAGVRAASWKSALTVAQTSTEIAPNSARAWNSLCLAWFDLGGGAKHGNPYLSQAIAACSQASEVDQNSILGLTNVISFKIMRGSVTPADWDLYLSRLERVPMTGENAKAIWVILNRARDGMHVDGDRMLKAIEINDRRRPFDTIASAAIGYFIIGNTSQPERAYPYFARAVSTAKDPNFSASLIDDLRKENREEFADRLQSLVDLKKAQ